MENYYQVLEVPYTADASEIMKAYERAYAAERFKVNNHDPEVVNEANAKLHLLEKARTTLLDPQKKQEHDALLGVIGGLVDPNAPQHPPTPAVTPSGGISPAGGKTTTPDSDHWICSKCKSAGVKGTKFCKKCGNQIGYECPLCQTINEASAQFCPNCGANLRELYLQIQQEEQERIERERQEEEERRRREEEYAMLMPIIELANKSQSHMKWGIICMLFIGPLTFGLGSLVGIGLLISAIINGRKVLNSSQVYGDSEYRKKGRTAMIVSVSVFGLLFLCMMINLIGGLTPYMLAFLSSLGGS